MAYSIDLRTRIVTAVDRGMRVSEVAQLFLVTDKTVYNYLQRRQATGSLHAKPISGRRLSIPIESMQDFIFFLSEHPEETLAGYCEMWEERTGKRLASGTMHNAIVRAGWTRKKKQQSRANGKQKSATRIKKR